MPPPWKREQSCFRRGDRRQEIYPRVQGLALHCWKSVDIFTMQLRSLVSCFVFMQFAYWGIYRSTTFWVCVKKKKFVLRILSCGNTGTPVLIEQTDLSLSAKLLRLFNLLLVLFCYYLWCLYMCWFAQNQAVWGIPAGFCLRCPPFHHVKSPDSFEDRGAPRDRTGY